jgi:hypothetical protein
VKDDNNALSLSKSVNVEAPNCINLPKVFFFFFNFLVSANWLHMLGGGGPDGN